MNVTDFQSETFDEPVKEKSHFHEYGEHEFAIDIDNEKARRKLHTGYKEIDDCVCIEAGKLTIIPAFSDHGKSIFLRNLCVNMYKLYPTVEFMYYTFEDNNYEVSSHMARLLYYDKYEKTACHMDAEAWESHLQKNDNIGAIGRGLQQQLSQRVLVYDMDVKVDEIEKHINSVIEKRPTMSVVFVDYLQDVEPNEYSGQHHADIERIVRYMHMTSKRTGVAFITACQYRPDVTKRKTMTKWDVVGLTRTFGSSSIYKKSRLFLSLFNRSRFEYEFKNKKTDPYKDDLEIDILKQKKQKYGKYLPLTLCKFSGRILHSDRVCDYTLDEDTTEDNY